MIKKLLPIIVLVAGTITYLAMPGSMQLLTGAIAAPGDGAPAGQKGAHAPASGVTGTAEEIAAIEVRRQELAAREAALAVKEEELKKLEGVLDARVKELDATRAALDKTLAAQKEVRSERYLRMLKIFKSLRPEEAARLVDKLDEEIAIEMLNRMDQKTAVKMIPFINQGRVLKWAKVNLQGS